MTYREILVAIRGSEARRLADLQEQAFIAYRQSDVIATLVGIVLGSKQKAPRIDEAFPGVFPKQEQPKQQIWQLMKARVEEYAAERRRRGEKAGGCDNTGGAPGSDHGRDQGVAQGA